MTLHLVSTISRVSGGEHDGAAAPLAVQNVTRTFGDFTALDSVSLTLAQGEFVFILGPSGCGKSTLLRLIAGLDDADSGDILIDGRSVTDVSPKDRGVAFVFQSYALYPHISARENIAAPLKMRELGAFDRLPMIGTLRISSRNAFASISARVSGMADLLRIGPYLHRRPTELSGGQRQRVARGAWPGTCARTASPAARRTLRQSRRGAEEPHNV